MSWDLWRIQRGICSSLQGTFVKKYKVKVLNVTNELQIVLGIQRCIRLLLAERKQRRLPEGGDI